jgi:tetratricopeptide (TPR) repeat protein
MATAAAPRPIWILGPRRDLAFFILPPLLIVPVILVLLRAVPVETLGLYVLGLGGFGHHLPGFIRAYADPVLFRSHWQRFTIVPALLILACATFSALNLNALVVATVAWGTWHGAMQISGFARIYDSRAGSFTAATARLDAWMCIAWFGLAIVCSPVKLFSLVSQFYLSGGLLIPAEAFRLTRIAWGAGTAIITILFLANAWRQWREGFPPNPIKLLLMGVSFAFWWYCTASLGSLILGVLMWEIFHDVQYNALVWHYQRRRVHGPDASPIERALFRPGWGRLALYLGLILAYGTIGVFASFADINNSEKALLGGGGSQWLLRVTVASALLHFYYDGFIWRIRQRAVRAGLGLDEGGDKPSTGSPALPGNPAAFSSHAWKWIFFVVPVAWLGLSEYRHWGPSFEAQIVNLSRGLPGSPVSHFLAGTYYKGLGRAAEAEEQYRLATRYNPQFAEGHLFLADMLYRRGAAAEAAAEYELAVTLNPGDAAVRRNLGFLLLSLGRPLDAARHFEGVLALLPDDAEAHFGMAAALARINRPAEAERHANRVLELEPAHSGALNYLGMIRQLRGDRAGARAYYLRALAADSDNASARQNLRDLDAASRTSDPAQIP